MSTEISRRRALQIAARCGRGGSRRGGHLEVRLAHRVLRPGSAPATPCANPRSWPAVTESSTCGSTAGTGVVLAGRRTRALGYNGTSPGPTLRVAPATYCA